MSTITIASTTDSAEQVQAALGLTPTDPPKTATPETPPAAVIDEKTPPAPPAEPAKEQTLAESTASEAGKALAARKSKLQERIDNLVRDKHDSAREAQEAKKQVEDLQKRLEAIEKGEKKPAAKADADLVEPAAPAKAAPAVGKPKQDDFDTYDDYVEALTDWKTDQKLAAREEAAKKADEERQVQTAAAQELDKRKSSIARAAEKYPDWHEKVAAAQNVPFNQQMGLYAGESEVGPELIYYLATHADKCAEIAALPPAKALLEMAKLEASYHGGTLFNEPDDDGVVTASSPAAPEATATATTPPPVKPAPPVSKAPVMVSRVTGGAAAATKPFDQMSYQEFKQWREQGGGR